MRHTKRKIVPFVFASGLLASSLAQAAQLGRLEVLSGAGEPFLAEIQVDLVAPEERATLQARLASSEAFKAARLTMDPNLKNLQFVVQDGKQPGTALVKVTSAQPLPAGFIDTLVELTWSGGRVAREYTLTIPAGPDTAAKPATSLPEIRPPMAPPPVAAPSATSPERDAQRAEVPASKTDAGDGALEVKRGDTLSELAMQLVGDGVTLNQAMAALYEANKNSFINGSVHLIREGAQIQVPNRAALRARNANEALLVLAQNDDRNVYSAYARQIGLLTVENQTASSASTSAQGSIAPQPKSDSAAAPQSDRLQIAPGAAQSAGNADANAEELLAKNKALAEANERIALLEKNVSDLQRLLDMQKDIGEAPIDSGADAAADAPSDAPAAVEDPAVADDTAVEVPSDTLGASVDAPTEQVETPVTEAPADALQDEPPFDWLPWILAGAGGLVALVVLLLVLRARRKNAETDENNGFDADDESSFSEVKEFDEAIVAASAGIAAERASNLNQAENSDFDLDEVLNDRLKQAGTDETAANKSGMSEVRSQSGEQEYTPELNEASADSKDQNEPLGNEVTLDFPEEEATESSSTSILDDLDEIEKGTLAAQEELDELRRQPVPQHDVNAREIDAAFGDLVGNEAETQKDADSTDETGNEDPASDTAEVPPEEAFDKALLDLDVDVPNPKVDDATWQEVATKLDLAGAYVEIGDADGAKELLNEIVKKGDVDQVRKAKALLATLN